MVDEAQFLRNTSRLLEKRNGSGISRRGEGTFRSNHDNWDALEVYELARGLRLNLVVRDTGFRRVHGDRLEFGGVEDRGIVGHRDRRHSPDIRSRKRLTAPLDGDDSLHEIRPCFRDQPAEGAARGMGDDNCRADLVEQHRAALAPNLMRNGLCSCG